MRVLLIPLDYQRQNETDLLFGDLLRAFQKQTNDTIIYDGSLQNAIDFNPDIIYFHGSMSVSELATLKQRTNAVITMWSGDARWLPQQCLMDYKQVIDIYFLPFTGQDLINHENIIGKKCCYIFEPFPDWAFENKTKENNGKIVFVGNVYEHLEGGYSRLKMVDFLSKHLPEFEVYGSINNSKGLISPFDVPKLYAESFMVIAENNITNIDGYFTPRNILPMMVGTCVIMKEFKGAKNTFLDNVNCLMYNSNYELLDKINFCKLHHEFRNEIADKGNMLANNNFRMDNFVSQYLFEINKWIKN